eukprot:snap_masked-scaffold_11-processed-gene-1.33-mRNA-1 protein AED:0.41 eAED:0.41 QI:0/0/0/0.5/1/1/4/0/177
MILQNIAILLSFSIYFPVSFLLNPKQKVIKNWKRKSVEGLSMIMFTCAILGNLTYGLSIIFQLPDENKPKDLLYHSLPWLIGSLGTLSFDFIILFQFWYFQEQNKDLIGEKRPLISGDDQHELVSVGTQHSLLAGIFGLRSWTSSPFLKPTESTQEIQDMESLDLDQYGSSNKVANS